VAIQPTDFPEAFYLQSAQNEQNSIYQADRNLSQILIQAHRGGALSLLDHIHLIASQDVQGYIQLNNSTGQCQSDLLIPLETLIVDDPHLRLENGLDASSSLHMITSIKKNMLKSIDAKNFPFVLIHSDYCSNALAGKNTQVTLTIHGVQQTRQLATKIQQNENGQLIISGEFSILQTDFGIEPFSIFNGLIKVEDQLDFTYQLLFNKIIPN
jgi:hypothetical protein